MSHTSHHSIRKWIIALNVKSIIILEGNIRKILCDLGLSEISLHTTPKAQFMKKHHKLDFIKIKKLLLFERHFKRIKRQATDWKKIMTNCMSDKGLLFRTYI